MNTRHSLFMPVVAFIAILSLSVNGYLLYRLDAAGSGLIPTLETLRQEVAALEQQALTYQVQTETAQNTIDTLKEDVAETNDQNRKLTESLNTVSRQVKNPPASSASGSVTAAVAKVSPAVVSVASYSRISSGLREVSAGSGFVISSNGYVVTNHHVVSNENSTYRITLADGQTRSATVVYRNADLDIAVLKGDGSGYTSVALGNSSSLQVGQTVVAIGNALGKFQNTVSVGIVSGLDRDIIARDRQGSERLEGMIQTDASINRGNSGGPLINAEGKVVGVNVATVLGSSNISFAIPIDMIRGILASYL